MVNARKLKIGFLIAVLFALLLFLFVVIFLQLQAKDPDPLRYAHQIDAFAIEDQSLAPAPVNVVFVGSSSIRKWDLAQSFPNMPAINRGFGGSELSDVDFFLKETVLKYDPDIVVVYAGENDIAGHKSGHTVLEDYKAIVGRLLAHNSTMSIIYISIKPTPAKWSSWKNMSAANDKIRAYSQEYENLFFVDVAEKMLDKSEETQAHLYIEDEIHLSPTGYEIWTEALSALLESLYREKRSAI